MSWTLEAGAEDAALSNYGSPVDLFFIKRLNALGYFSAYIPSLGGLAEPAREDVVRLTWDKGRSTETTHFEGVIADVRRMTNVDAFRVRGFDLLGKLWKSDAGGIRDYEAVTPHRIIQGAGTPNPLLTNAQGNSVMAYGSASDVPNKIDATNPGVAMTYRADSGKLLVNVQRLALQAQYNNTATPAALRWGLEFFARLEGANNSTPTFYLVRRREQSPAPAESFRIPDDFFKARRGEEGATAADAIKVVGSGDGQQRVEGAIIGSGGLEGVVADKTILGVDNAEGNGNADVMANRLSELLSPTTEVVTAAAFPHAFDTDVGDTVTVTEDGVTNASLRVFEIGYSLQMRRFFWTVGRPRPFYESGFIQVADLLQGQAQGPQRLGAGATRSVTEGPTTISDGAAVEATLNLSPAFRPQIDEALQFVIIVEGTDTDGTTEGKFDVQLANVAGTAILYRNRHLVPHGNNGAMEIPLYFSNEAIIRELGTGNVSSVELTVTNRSGDDRDTLAQLFAMVVG